MMRTPGVAGAILVALTWACEPVTEPAAERTFEVRTADGIAVPATVACPAPLNSEAWVTFGSGTLTMRTNATFTWKYEVSRGVRSWTPGPNGERQNVTQSVSGGPRHVEGSFRGEADGSYSLDYERAGTDDTPLTGTGYVQGETAYIQESVACPQAPAGTAPHAFRLVLKEVTAPAATASRSSPRGW